jgi:DNA-binding MarR family transcriptional regulator
MTKKTKSSFGKRLHLGFLTNRIGRLMGIHLQKRMDDDEFDMPGHCIGILSDLWDKDGVIQKDLAISVVKDKGTITRALDLMEKKNIIVRITDEKDKRNKKIFLTYKGTQLRHKIFFHGDGVVKDAKESISEEDYETCIRVLEKIYYNLKDKL